MPSRTVRPPKKALDIDPAQFGVSASPEAMQRLVAAVTESVRESVTAAVVGSITESVTASLHAKFQAEYDAKFEESLRQRVQEIYEQLRLARHRQFGRSSEAHAGQGRLFDEAEALALGTTEADDIAPLAQEANTGAEDGNADTIDAPEARKPTRRGKREPLPAELPRVDVVHDVPQEERTCPCGAPMVEIGEEVSEQLDIIPMQIRVLRHIRKRYACPEKTQPPVTAPVPAQVLPKSNASAGLLAMLLTTKYVDGLPLARFEYVLARSGATVPRQTLARWVIGAAKALQPLHNLLRDALLDSAVIHMDETVLQVLKEPDKSPSSQSYMWVQVAGPPDKPIVLYDYDPSRSGQVPLRLLEGWRGYLMTDGYEGYSAVGRTDGVEHLMCWAHARRKFIEAQRVQAKGKRGRADQAVELIARLYRVEREIKHATSEERHAARQARSLPVLAALRQWLDKTLPAVPPKTALGMAVAYLDKYWPKLVRFTERGDLPVDNNRVENSIRPFVVGRNAWLFSDTPAGAHASAVVYSLVETAKACGLEPYTWLCRALRRLPQAQCAEDYEALLPWNIHTADLAMEIAG